MLCISMPPSSVTFDPKMGLGVGIAVAMTENELSPPKRPKLSLQTTGCDRPRTFGKSSTSLMLSTSSGETNSPTINNTYFNAYHAPRAPTTATRPTASPSPTTTTTITGRVSILRSSEDTKPPYSQPLGIRSILRNGPLPRPTPRSASRQAHPRLRFPPAKRVSYKTPLWEEIRTSRYTVAHYDLVLFEQERKDGNVPDAGEIVRSSTRVEEEEEKHEDDDNAGRKKEGEDVSTPLSPRKRSKPKREWTWTLASPPEQDEQDRTRVALAKAVEKPDG